MKDDCGTTRRRAIFSGGICAPPCQPGPAPVGRYSSITTITKSQYTAIHIFGTLESQIVLQSGMEGTHRVIQSHFVGTRDLSGNF